MIHCLFLVSCFNFVFPNILIVDCVTLFLVWLLVSAELTSSDDSCIDEIEASDVCLLTGRPSGYQKHTHTYVMG